VNPIPAIFGDEVILLDVLVGEAAPARHLGGRHQQQFLQATLDGHILADGLPCGGVQFSFKKQLN